MTHVSLAAKKQKRNRVDRIHFDSRVPSVVFPLTIARGDLAVDYGQYQFLLGSRLGRISTIMDFPDQLNR